ncbi:hypothetical protein HK101_008260 [Irineochytrium annulatum]|nr:hypothetical protein HK101_008260 [Irineochytrium annulatum]
MAENNNDSCNDNYNRNGSSGGVWDPLELQIARAQAEFANANLEFQLMRSVASSLPEASSLAAFSNAALMPAAALSTTTSAIYLDDFLPWAPPTTSPYVAPPVPSSFRYGTASGESASFNFPPPRDSNRSAGMTLGSNLLNYHHSTLPPFLPPTTIPSHFLQHHHTTTFVPTTMLHSSELHALLIPNAPTRIPPDPKWTHPEPETPPVDMTDSRDALSESPPGAIWSFHPSANPVVAPGRTSSITSSSSRHSSPVIGPTLLSQPLAASSSSSSGGAPSQPAVIVTRKRRSRARNAVREVLCGCGVCGAPLGSMHLVGEEDDFAAPFVCDVVCASCGGDGESGGGSKGKKRKRGARKRVECRICLEVQGSGGCRVPAGDERRAAGAEAWIEPSFKAELFCRSCEEEFRFCSSCGGGSTTRSGKWRPRQLFNASRKTCLLPHSRAGSASQLHTVSYRLLTSTSTPTIDYTPIVMLGDEMTDIPFAATSSCPPEVAIRELTPVIQDHVESTLLQTMDATVMRGSSLPTFESLSCRATELRAEVARFLDPSSRSPGVRRYLNVVYSPDARPTGQRRAVVGAGGWAVGACLAFYWDVTRRVVGCAFSSCRVQMSGRSDVLLQELRLSLLRIQRDADAGLERPSQISVAVTRGGRLYTRTEAVLRSCGFATIGEYLGGLGMGGVKDTEREELRERLKGACGMDEGQSDGFETFVADCRATGELLAID